jgi:hypothetical protein
MNYASVLSLYQKLIDVQQTLIKISKSIEMNHFPIQEKPNNPISVNFYFYPIPVTTKYPTEN